MGLPQLRRISAERSCARRTSPSESSRLWRLSIPLEGCDRAMKIDKTSQIKALPRRKTLTFGEFVEGVYRHFDDRRAKEIVQLAINLNVVKFHGKKRYLIS
jgi:hypothetical protein